MTEWNGNVGVALFGLGRAGRIHAGNIMRHRRLTLRYIVEVDLGLKLAEKFIEENYLTNCTSVTTWDESDSLFSDENVHFVIVTAPTGEHEKIVRRSIHAGKGVFCEKPVALTIATTEDLYKEAEERGVPLFCCFQRRFDPGFSSIRQRVREGKIGRVHMVTTFSRDSPCPTIDYLRISGGIFHDCGVHDIDLICWIIGETPASVFVRAATHKKEIAELDDWDTAAIILTFPSGAIGTAHLSRHSSFYDQRLEAHGDQGVVSCGNPPTTAVSFGDGAGMHSDPLEYSFPQRYRVAYAAELDHFLDVLTKKTPKLLVTCRDTILASKVATACDESFKLNKPVEIK